MTEAGNILYGQIRSLKLGSVHNILKVFGAMSTRILPSCIVVFWSHCSAAEKNSESEFSR
jgi:hypothetical protein